MADSFQTVVHIAAEPDGLIQRCLRCHAILVDARGAMAIGVGTVSLGCWQPGGFVGVTEGNPTVSNAMTRDAAAIDEIACNLVGAAA